MGSVFGYAAFQLMPRCAVINRIFRSQDVLNRLVGFSFEVVDSTRYLKYPLGQGGHVFTQTQWKLEDPLTRRTFGAV